MLKQQVRTTTARMLAICAAVACSATIASAMWVLPEPAPVARLVTNLTAFTKANPTDANGFYRLARVHSLAFSLNTDTLNVYRGREDDQAARVADANGDKPSGKPLSDEERRSHLAGAIRNFNQAIALDARPSEYYLGLASVLEVGRALAGEVDVLPFAEPQPGKADLERAVKQIESLGDDEDSMNGLKHALRYATRVGEISLNVRNEAANALFASRETPDPKRRERVRALLKLDWEEQTTEAYFTAMSLGLPAQSKSSEKPMRGLNQLASYQAAKAYVRLVRERGPRPDETTRLRIADGVIAAFDSMAECTSITPIIFSTSKSASLTDLLSPHVTTHFDLDGTGRGTLWPWVKNDTSILVWDPQSKGKITSGRQLFGSVTWWMFFKDGYQALDGLDDNRNGELAGDELAGLGIWTDRNSNGASDAGEVVTLNDAGVEAISCRATGFQDGSPSNALGLRMTDGRVFPTYDWTTSPAKPRHNGSSGAAASASSAVVFAAYFATRRRSRGCSTTFSLRNALRRIIT